VRGRQELRGSDARREKVELQAYPWFTRRQISTNERQDRVEELQTLRLTPARSYASLVRWYCCGAYEAGWCVVRGRWRLCACRCHLRCWRLRGAERDARGMVLFEPARHYYAVAPCFIDAAAVVYDASRSRRQHALSYILHDSCERYLPSARVFQPWYAFYGDSEVDMPPYGEMSSARYESAAAVFS